MAIPEDFIRHDAPRSLMRQVLRSHWREAMGCQRFLYLVGTALIASAVFHTGVLIVTGGSLEGDTSWRKPILFGEAFGLTCVSVGWVLGYLPRRPRLGWTLARALGIANIVEVLWVSIQQWRGVPSHFNTSTDLDGALFGAAGVAIGFTVTVVFVVTGWALIALRARASVAWAIRAGMLLLSFGQVLGIVMIVNEGNTVGTDGVLTVSHGLAMHAIQVLPLLAGLLLVAYRNEAPRTIMMLVGAAGYTVLVAITALRAFGGDAPLALSLPGGLALLAGIAALGIAWLVAARAALGAPRDLASGG